MSLLFLLMVSWCSAASLQQPDATSEPQEVDNPLYPLTDSRSQFDPYDNNPLSDGDFYKTLEQIDGSFYKTDANQEDPDKGRDGTRKWIPNIVDSDKTIYINVNGDSDNPSSFIVAGLDRTIDKLKEKRSFSPWGGKRAPAPPLRNRGAHIWSWKRTPQSKDSNMPKRVRFSPWGGKRSANVIFKPSKTSKIIYSTLSPELWSQLNDEDPSLRFAKGSSPLISSFKKKYQLLKFKRNDHEYMKRNRLPLYDFTSRSLNSMDLTSKKDGKRKVKFSAWGGKRSHPIIGPVWAPSMETIKDRLNTIFLVNDDSDRGGRLQL